MYEVLQAPRGSFWDRRMMWKLNVNYWYLGGIIGKELQGALGQEWRSFSERVTALVPKQLLFDGRSIWITVRLVLKMWCGLVASRFCDFRCQNCPLQIVDLRCLMVGEQKSWRVVFWQPESAWIASWVLCCSHREQGIENSLPCYLWYFFIFLN